MLKPIVTFITLACFTATFPGFAQGTSQENLTYVQQAQKMLDQSTAQANKQFDKSYPKPTAPTIQNSSSPQKVPPPALPKKPTPSEKTAGDNNAASNTYSYDNSPKVVSNPPVFTTPSDQQRNSSQPAQNIYTPPNSANNTGASSAPNPYR